MKKSFNQEYTQFNKKYRTKKIRELHGNEEDYNFQDIITDAHSNNLIDFDSKIISIGGGKEALVILGTKNNESVIFKAFRPYSSSNVKRYTANYHVTAREMAATMAKKEFWNYKILYHFNINVPKPFQYVDGSLGFTMQFLKGNHSEEPAPLLKHVNLNEFWDPGDFLEIILDQLLIMFKTANFVHGDLSEFNILISNDKPFIIDVSQGRLFNVNTFTSTPVRIRIDRAISIMTEDIKNILDHFLKDYRITFNLDDVLNIFFKDLPDFAEKYTIKNWRNSKENDLTCIPSRKVWEYKQGGEWMTK